jgi:hypothetical protein
MLETRGRTRVRIDKGQMLRGLDLASLRLFSRLL